MYLIPETVEELKIGQKADNESKRKAVRNPRKNKNLNKKVNIFN